MNIPHLGDGAGGTAAVGEITLVVDVTAEVVVYDNQMVLWVAAAAVDDKGDSAVGALIQFLGMDTEFVDEFGDLPVLKWDTESKEEGLWVDSISETL